MRVSEPNVLPEKKLASAFISKAPPFSEWQPYKGLTKEPGYFYTTEDLKEIRDEYLRQDLFAVGTCEGFNSKQALPPTDVTDYWSMCRINQ